ncbi:hypothetical protein EBU24_00715 [bacterium]|jgi:hypothetical protein|nr:hypothetical protein [bacterium]
MSQTRNYITIDSVINDYIDESEQSVHKYAKLYNIAVRGMEKLGLDFFYKIRTVKVPIDTTNYTAELPNDYISYTKIGVLNSVGEIIPLKFNNKMTYYADQQPDRLALTQDDTLATWYQSDLPLWYNYWDGYGFNNIYGLPSGSPFVGSFNIDDSNGVVLLNEYFYYSYLMIEYLSSGNPDEPYRIPIQFREALLSWLAWRDIASMPSNRKGNLGDKRDRKQEFYNQRRIANAQFKPLYLMQAYEWNLDNQRMTVKA